MTTFSLDTLHDQLADICTLLNLCQFAAVNDDMDRREFQDGINLAQEKAQSLKRQCAGLITEQVLHQAKQPPIIKVAA